MKVLDALLESLTHRETPVRRVCTGAFWTLVTTRFSALSATYRDLDLQHSDDPQVVPDAGRLTEKTAGELAEFARLEETVAASIGVAAINSLIEADESRCTEQSAFDILAEKGAGRRVAVIGHFPFIPKLREIAKTVWVLEKRLRPGDLPAEEASRILPQADVVCLTATSLINKTIDALLDACRGSYVVLTGPSSPMTPTLFDLGISAVCGARVLDPDLVARHITQGACFRQLRGNGVRLLTMRKE
jgi:uncharacterized protein (DUF4213/DUF364 family)